MTVQSFTVFFFASLLGSTLCVIPEGEIQIGPIFGKGSRIFGGNKHFELGFEKGGDLKHLLAKKALLGVGVLGAGAVAAGGAALLAKKFPHLHNGWGWSGSSGYGKGQYSNNYNSVPLQSSYGWNNNQQSGGYYQNANANLQYPASSYPTSTSSSYYGNNNYPSTSYGYPETEWQASSGSYGGSYGWSR